MNDSEKNNPAKQKKWRKSGALGGVPEAQLNSARSLGPLKIVGIGEHFVGPADGGSTLSLGERVVNVSQNPADRWIVTEPVIAVVVETQGKFKLGEKIKIPRKAKHVDRVFPPET